MNAILNFALAVGWTIAFLFLGLYIVVMVYSALRGPLYALAKKMGWL